MQTIETDEYLIEYPNSLVFCFSPAIIRIKRIAVINLTFAKLRIWKGSTSWWDEVREVDASGQIVFNASKYIQMSLSDIEHSYIDYLKKTSYNPNFENIKIEVFLYSSPDIADDTAYEASHQFSLTGVWGCLDISESFGGAKERTWFVNYPFTIDLYSKTGNYFDVYVDGVHDDQVFSITAGKETNKLVYHPYLLNLEKLFAPPLRELYVAAPACKRIKNDIEDEGVASYRLKIDRSTSGVYLRWVDRQGLYCYYLFKSSTKTVKVSAEQTFIRDEMLNPLAYDTNGLHRGDGINFSKSVERTVGLSAPLVDSETFEYLKTLLASPVVDMLVEQTDMGTKWQRINVPARTLSESSVHLQDFMITIELPKQSQQS